MIALREFKTAAEMRAHYGVIRARLYPPAPKAEPPAPSCPWVAPRKPVLPTMSQTLQRLEERRRDASSQAANDHYQALAILEVAATHFGVSLDDVMAGSRTSTVRDARFVGCFLIRQWFGRGVKNHSNPRGNAWIGKQIKRDSTTVHHAIRRVENSPRLRYAAERIELTILGGTCVEISHFVRVDPEAYTLKRTCRAGAEL